MFLNITNKCWYVISLKVGFSLFLQVAYTWLTKKTDSVLLPCVYCSKTVERTITYNSNYHRFLHIARILHDICPTKYFLPIFFGGEVGPVGWGRGQYLTPCQPPTNNRTETTHHQQVGQSESQLLTVLLKSGISVYALAFVLEADILSTHWNKGCVMWRPVVQYATYRTYITHRDNGTNYELYEETTCSNVDWSKPSCNNKTVAEKL